ncbi:MAG: FtsB family cell division protein [Patescibacteria group bacterium]
MREVKKQTQKRRIFSLMYGPGFFSLIGVIILVVISVPLARGLTQKNEVEKEISKIEAEINNLESQNKELDRLVGYLQSDRFLEKQARTSFGLKKRGEEVVVIKEEEREGKVAGVSASSDEQNKERKEEERSNPGKWAEYFFEN